MLTPKVTLFGGAAGAAGVVFALAFGGLQPSESDDATPLATVQRGDVEIKVTEAGELRAAHQATISASNDKQIVWLAPEGSRVSEGDAVVRLAAEKYEIAKLSAESALRVAKAQWRRARSELQGKRAVEEQARLEYESLPELAEKGYINKGEVDQARLAYEEVQAATRSYEAAVVAARANVDGAEQALRQGERRLAEVTLHAPRDGLVVYAAFGPPTDPKKISVGMVPFEGQDLMYLPDTSSMLIDTEISEFDLAKVREGSAAVIRLAAYPDQEFRGKVARVSTLARQRISQVTGKPTGLKVFDVEVAMLDSDPRLKPGLSATVEILVRRHESVLYVPVAGVFLDEHERTVVYARNGDTKQRAVEVAETNDRVAIIASGLEEGERILLTRPQPL